MRLPFSVIHQSQMILCEIFFVAAGSLFHMLCMKRAALRPKNCLDVDEFGPIISRHETVYSHSAALSGVSMSVTFLVMVPASYQLLLVPLSREVQASRTPISSPCVISPSSTAEDQRTACRH